MIEANPESVHVSSDDYRLNPSWLTVPGQEGMHFMDPGEINWRLSVRTPTWRPPTDVFETEESVVVRVEVAGMREEDFNIALDDSPRPGGTHLLSIRGSRQDQVERNAESGGRAFHRMEIRFGEFICEVELPISVQPDKVEAIYQGGFLKVTLPKSRPVQVHISEEER